MHNQKIGLGTSDGQIFTKSPKLSSAVAMIT